MTKFRLITGKNGIFFATGIYRRKKKWYNIKNSVKMQGFALFGALFKVYFQIKFGGIKLWKR